MEKLNCDTNRIKLRREFLLKILDENDQSFASKASTTDSTSSQKNVNFTFPKGGIDLNIGNEFDINKARDYKFSGIIFDKKNDEIFLARNDSDKYQLKIKRNMINLEDLAVVLKIFCDPTIKHKTISFSLDPFEKNNPQGKFMRKVYYPDRFENKRILAGTKLGEDMFQADYIMKQMSLGIQPNNTDKFAFPEELSKLGLKPQHAMRTNNSESHEMKWSRAWIVVHKFLTFKTKDQLLMIDGIKMGVEARQLNVADDGSLKDSQIQDINDECYKFSKKLTELYEPTGKYYKSFERLKEISNAIVMAKWIVDNNIPIDLNMINEIYKNSLIQEYEEKVPSINYREIVESEEKVLVDMTDLAKRSLEHSKLEITPKNIEFAINQIQEKNPGKVYYDTRIKKQEYFLFGGVDLTSNLAKNNSEMNFLDDNSSQSTKDEQHFMEETKIEDFGQFIVKKQNNINVDLTEFNLKRFPLLTQQYCSVCDKTLTLNEMKINKIFKKMLGNDSYCSIHNPYNCGTCLKVIQNSYVTMKNQNYHAECLRCFGCEQKIKEMTMICENEVLFHKECYEKYLKDKTEIFNDIIDLAEKNNFEKEKINISPEKDKKEKRKSEEFENFQKEWNQKQMKELGETREQRGKTVKQKQPSLLQKIQKK